ncbi:AMP-binding protein [Mycolicibacterium flavescens]|uniref:Acyl-CoA synthetase n=1 Tax=Mycolicibacterium flavescens TaxID=1776 RepID=A0A1E3RE91_MYCFV|nr:AMP-binding protein [Mycolicibacterium flavescens]MCV7282678.1 AMP-binding protein [Mycolicibacterium flavescens]ODQ88205.1 acyl-CoA synthetase [Mycolicibacterium flavescens]
MMGSSIPAVLRERSSLQPNDTAFTFIDYAPDGTPLPETLTYSQLYKRSANVAAELSVCGEQGDRAVILAPQSLDYIAAFIGSLQAGLIAVPLSVPQPGAHDERVTSVLRDTAPTVILTTSAVAEDVRRYAEATETNPTVVVVDTLESDNKKIRRIRGDVSQEVAYLQYTSGSTREPAGVMVTNRNLSANFEQMYADYFTDIGKIPPPNTAVVSWLPFYHDMGLLLGICVPILGGLPSVLMSPLSFLERPARWIQLLGEHGRTLTAAPNFAFELAVKRTTEDDMSGVDLSDVLGVISGSERVHAATVQRFTEKFTKFGFPEKAIRASYGLAEATVYVATRAPGSAPLIVDFESEKLSAGHAERRAAGGGTPLISYGTPESVTVRIVDPETNTESPAGTIGEIWVHGENVAAGYWQKPQETARTFGGTLVSASAGLPESKWLRTGDLGFMSDGELFIMGRIKDVLIVYGRNHYPEDIEATISEITGGRVAAIAVSDARVEKLVAIVELKKRGDTDEEVRARFESIKGEVASAISRNHGLSASELVLVAPGSIPITTSGKIRRSTCVEMYNNRQFTRLDA